MQLNELIQPGMTLERSLLVEEQHAAPHVGSGSLRVLATPWMIAFMEGSAHRLLMQSLPAGYSSVGVVVNIRHLAPTPIGSSLRVRAEVLAVDGLRATFLIEAWDEIEKIGEGQHERMVIDEARFMKRVMAKGGEP
jgi:predicted thioesterase